MTCDLILVSGEIHAKIIRGRGGESITGLFVRTDDSIDSTEECAYPGTAGSRWLSLCSPAAVELYNRNDQRTYLLLLSLPQEEKLAAGGTTANSARQMINLIAVSGMPAASYFTKVFLNRSIVSRYAPMN
jgi:hypothetical protein